MDFSKLEAGKIDLESADVDVRTLVEDVGAIFAPEAHIKKLELLTHIPPDVASVLRGDAGRIRQVLIKLASNAVKFTSSGQVGIKVNASPLDTGGVSVRFEVEDTGIGIAEGSRDRLFESFSQADASTTRRYGGTGLGLAICHRLVAAMGGTLGFDSTVGTGSTFWFQIPLAPAADHLADVPAQPPEMLTGLRVLVVDDKAAQREILAVQLTSWDLDPDLVPDSPSALERMRAMAATDQPYDVAVIDLCVPEMDGLQLAQIISTEPALAKTRTVMLTSSLHVDVAGLKLAGVSEWLPKPVRSSELQNRLIRLTTPPVATPVPSAAAPHGPGISGPLGRVLVVDDNPLNQLLAEAIVTALGYQVDAVGDGAEALEALLGTSYTAILMDCHMPVMDGLEATREIRRRQESQSRTPIIATTASVMFEEQERCLAAGMDDYISKPMTLQSVQSVLAQWGHPAKTPVS